MIIEGIIGLVMNVIMADNATGHKVSKGILMYSRLERQKIEPKEEIHQLVKDTILEVTEENASKLIDDKKAKLNEIASEEA